MSTTRRCVLPAQLRSVPQARQMVREILEQVDGHHFEERAELAVSELVTNAVVHAGSRPEVRLVASAAGVRVEVDDTSSHLPTRRGYAATAGTGRGLGLLDHSADRWGVDRTAGGKTVWFEIGDPPGGDGRPEPVEQTATPPEVVVRLLEVPLLMHWAWQEHAQSLLREYLLLAFDDDPSVLDHHAQASDALALLHEQVPRPVLPDDPDALLADTLDPDVTAREVALRLPSTAIDHFVVLESLLGRAAAAAHAEGLLGPATQPEMVELREWLCAEVARQGAGPAEPRPWATSMDAAAVVAGAETLLDSHPEIGTRLVEESPGDVLVTNEVGVIVALSRTVTAFLGYPDDADLVGRRVMVVIPDRYRQAHVAGMTLHATNGRDPLLDVSLSVPVVRADGSEALVGLRVSSRFLGGASVFVAEFTLPTAA